jgi:C-terminal processing protease CtpA/Prc
MGSKLKLLFTHLVLLPALLFAGTDFPGKPLTTKAQQIIALDVAITELSTHYGMRKFKDEHFGKTLDSMRAKYSRLIENAETLEESAGLSPKIRREVLPPEEAIQLLIGLAAEFKDGHFNIARAGYPANSLGIFTAGIDGHLYVTGTQPDLFVADGVEKKLKVGDEVLEVNGVPVSKLAHANLFYIQRATYADRYRTALEFILQPSPRYLRPIQSGSQVRVKFKRGEETFTGDFFWIKTKELNFDRAFFPEAFKFPNREIFEKDVRPFTFAATGAVRTYFREGLESAVDKTAIVNIGQLINAEVAKENASPAGQKSASTEPAKAGDDAAKLKKAIERLQAYIVRRNGKNIGVIRIPDYSGPSMIEEIMWLGRAVAYMQSQADVLVLDLLQNGGGANFYAGFILKYFASKPLPTMKIDIKLSKTLLRDFFAEVQKPGDLQNEFGIKMNLGDHALAQELEKRWTEKLENGDGWTGLIGTHGDSVPLVANQAGQRTGSETALFTKPILVLNDVRSGSNGDMVPSILQESGRAVVMGETSMGLGGMVYREQESLPGSELSMRCTAGVCYKADGTPIENRGTIPDLFREVTRDDLLDDFKAYSQQVLEVASAHADGKSVDTLREIVGRPQAEKLAQAIQALSPQKQELVTAIREKITDMQMDGEFNSLANPEVVLAASQRFLGQIIRLLKQADLPEIVLKSFEIPLPLYLKKDILLNGLYKRDEVRNRLSEMRNREIFRSPADQNLISYWEENLPQSHFRTCEKALVN